MKIEELLPNLSLEGLGKWSSPHL